MVLREKKGKTGWKRCMFEFWQNYFVNFQVFFHSNKLEFLESWLLIDQDATRKQRQVFTEEKIKISYVIDPSIVNFRQSFKILYSFQQYSIHVYVLAIKINLIQIQT